MLGPVITHISYLGTCTIAFGSMTGAARQRAGLAGFYGTLNEALCLDLGAGQQQAGGGE